MNNNSFPTEEEKEIILSCVEKTGELYSLFGLGNLENEPTNNQIRDAYNFKIRNLNKKSHSKELEIYKEAYDILSDKRLREIYNLYYLQVVVENEMKNTLIIKNLVTAIAASGSYAIERTHSLVASKQGLVNPIGQGKEIYKNSGLLGFYRGYLVSAASVYPEQLIGLPIINLIDAYMVNSNNFQSIPLYEYVRSLIKSTISNIIGSPIRLILHCIWMSPYNYSIIQVVKKVVLREQIVFENGITKSHFNFKNIFYAFGSTLLLKFTTDLVFHLTSTIQLLIERKVRKYPTSSFWKYSALIYNNIFFQGILNSLLTSPFEVARLKYTSEFVNSYINGTPIPKVINPVQMIQKIIKTEGFYKLYNGCSLLSSINIINLFIYYYNQ